MTFQTTRPTELRGRSVLQPQGSRNREQPRKFRENEKSEMSARIDSLPANQRHEYRLMHDTRAICDIAWFRFADFETNGEPSWVVAMLDPSPDSGNATIPGSYIKAETGELVIPSGVAAVVLKKGRWHSLASALPTPSGTGIYSWSEPLEREQRVLSPEDYYSPFAYGGTIVFRPTPSAPDIEEFGPVCLLFDDWGSLVQPAFERSRKGDEILYGKFSYLMSTDKLTQLVSDDNGLVATIAFRELMRIKPTDARAVAKFLEATDQRRRSIFSYVMLAMSDSGSASELTQAVTDSVRAARQPEEIQSISLGAFAAALFHSREAGVLASSRNILLAARQRFQIIGRAGERASQLLLIFQKMGIEN